MQLPNSLMHDIRIPSPIDLFANANGWMLEYTLEFWEELEGGS